MVCILFVKSHIVLLTDFRVLCRCDIAQVALYCLHKVEAAPEYIDLKNDIYPFVNEHFDLLHCSKAGMRTLFSVKASYILSATRVKWKKLLLDSLTQGKDLYES